MTGHTLTDGATSPVPRTHVELVDQAIDLPALRNWLRDFDSGAHAWFEGITRRMTGDRQTVRLAYEAFAPMATKQLQHLAQEAAAEFNLRAIAIVHRLGVVPVGEASIVIGCGAAHRAGALAALPWLMDRIKADVAIWKQEQFADGLQQWVHPK